MKIIITKEEAINAWKKENLQHDSTVLVEIENTSLVGNGTTTLPIPYVGDSLKGTGGTILCGDETNNK